MRCCARAGCPNYLTTCQTRDVARMVTVLCSRELILLQRSAKRIVWLILAGISFGFVPLHGQAQLSVDSVEVTMFVGMRGGPVSDVSSLLGVAREQFEVGDSHSARNWLIRVLQLDPNNAIALRGLAETNEKIVQKGGTARDRPQFDAARYIHPRPSRFGPMPVSASEPSFRYSSEGVAATITVQKFQRIGLPDYTFNDAPLVQVLDQLRSKSVWLDPALDPGFTGGFDIFVEFLKPSPAELASKAGYDPSLPDNFRHLPEYAPVAGYATAKINLQLHGASLLDALCEVAAQAGLRVEVGAQKVLLIPVIWAAPLTAGDAPHTLPIVLLSCDPTNLVTPF